MSLLDEDTRQEVLDRNFDSWLTPDDASVRRAFRAFDLDGNGVLDKAEVRKSLKKHFAVELSRGETDAMFLIYDRDRNGCVRLREFRDFRMQLCYSAKTTKSWALAHYSNKSYVLVQFTDPRLSYSTLDIHEFKTLLANLSDLCVFGFIFAWRGTLRRTALTR